MSAYRAVRALRNQLADIDLDDRDFDTVALYEHLDNIVTRGARLRRRAAAAATALGFLTCILGANYATTEYGLIPVGLGLTATAGTYFAGLSFVLRDTLQDTAGKAVALGIIALGAALSYIVADPFIATASATAFLAAEVSDLVVYTPLRRRGYIRAAIASNIVGATVDTFLFLWIAGFPVTDEAVTGQLVAKLAVTALVVIVVRVCRAVPREPLRK